MPLSVYAQAASANTISSVCNSPREECPTVEDGMRVVHRACGTNELRRGEIRWPSMGLLFRYWMGFLGDYAWDKGLGTEINTRDSRSFVYVFFFLLWNYRLDILIIQMRVWQKKKKNTLCVLVQSAWHSIVTRNHNTDMRYTCLQHY